MTINLESENIKKSENLDVWVSGDYLLKLEPLVDLTEKIKLGLDNNNPVYFESENDNFKLRGWVAARADYDEEQD